MTKEILFYQRSTKGGNVERFAMLKDLPHSELPESMLEIILDSSATTQNVEIDFDSSKQFWPAWVTDHHANNLLTQGWTGYLSVFP